MYAHNSSFQQELSLLCYLQSWAWASWWKQSSAGAQPGADEGKQQCLSACESRRRSMSGVVTTVHRIKLLEDKQHENQPPRNALEKNPRRSPTQKQIIEISVIENKNIPAASCIQMEGGPAPPYVILLSQPSTRQLINSFCFILFLQ
ncbi:hypothetical protein KIL84_007168 [Mauremys mutica]|uniref:Uncharacterized protein n=1 Tax=Mauremys mutica TaxID=74926 RepID=A0A9D3X2K7_9SAUR|nr:hypothetical protein KIL84_007168 [Mauremys mutica]